ncbi:MAG: hypothetical protein D3910_08750 [Candidatus Electrothrix sp. ATG2]|nr:hypothetical protein [Candidatus Electrothrix sp. ATG2]
MNIEVVQEDTSEMCSISFSPFGYDHKHAWLVIASKPLLEKEQELRTPIWGQGEMSRSIELLAKLSPMKYEQVTKENYKESKYIVTISRDLAYRSYVYIDFPRLVFDGGYYYSIPLSSYCKAN